MILLDSGMTNGVVGIFGTLMSLFILWLFILFFRSAGTPVQKYNEHSQKTPEQIKKKDAEDAERKKRIDEERKKNRMD